MQYGEITLMTAHICTHSMVYGRGSPQAKWRGTFWIWQPYLKHKASLKYPLCKTNPCSMMAEQIPVRRHLSFWYILATVVKEKRVHWKLLLFQRVGVTFCISHRGLDGFCVYPCSHGILSLKSNHCSNQGLIGHPAKFIWMQGTGNECYSKLPRFTLYQSCTNSTEYS